MGVVRSPSGLTTRRSALSLNNPPGTNQAGLTLFLAGSGGGGKDGLQSRYVEDPVGAHPVLEG